MKDIREIAKKYNAPKELVEYLVIHEFNEIGAEKALKHFHDNGWWRHGSSGWGEEKPVTPSHDESENLSESEPTVTDGFTEL